VNLTVQTGEEGKKLIQKFEADLKKTVLIAEISFKENEGQDLKAGDLAFRVKIDKI